MDRNKSKNKEFSAIHVSTLRLVTECVLRGALASCLSDGLPCLCLAGPSTSGHDLLQLLVALLLQPTETIQTQYTLFVVQIMIQ